MLLGRPGRPLRIFQFASAGRAIWSGHHHLDARWPIRRVAILDPVDRIAERAGWTLADRVDDLQGGVAVGVDPRVGLHVEDGRQAAGAEAGTRADVSVVVDGDLPTRVIVAAIGGRTTPVHAGEADLAVRSVAERLVG
jgi:hypothetical protein